MPTDADTTKQDDPTDLAATMPASEASPLETDASKKEVCCALAARCARQLPSLKEDVYPQPRLTRFSHVPLLPAPPPWLVCVCLSLIYPSAPSVSR